MLDINTKKGQEYLRYEQELIQIISNKYEIEIIQTDKKREARIDNLFLKKNQLVCIGEMKCRNMKYDSLIDYGSWLITYQKIKDGAEISKLLCVPFYGFLFLMPERKVLMWKITDDKGNFLFDFEVKRTQTQKTCNGGEVYRDNAYLPVSFMKVI